MKKLLSFIIITGLILTNSIYVLAEKPSLKEESIFALLDINGNVRDIYVVNSIESGHILDYGDYKNITNLSDSQALKYDGEAITADLRKERLFYQGTLSATELPWNISIKYMLDGKELSANEIAGRGGELEILLSITSNPLINQKFFENYLLQVTLTLDTKICESISSPGAVIANAGINKLITHTVLPGHGAEISVKASVTDFHMEGVEFAATPFSMSIDLPDIGDFTNDMNELSSAINSLNKGMKELESGLSATAVGTKGLVSGSADFMSGLSELSTNSKQLISASSLINTALSEIALSISQIDTANLSQLSALPAGLKQLSLGLDDILSGLEQIKSGSTLSLSMLESAINEIPNTDIDPTELYKIAYGNTELTSLLDKLVEYYASAKKTKATFLAIKPSFTTIETSFDTISDSINLISKSLLDISENVEKSQNSSDFESQFKYLAEGLAQLSDNYSAFHLGLNDYMNGVSELSGGYKMIDDGISDLSNGFGSLSFGAGELSDGTQQLDEGLSDLPNILETEIEALISQFDSSSFVPISFVSEKNTEVSSVQFVFKTDSIKIENPTSDIFAEPVKLTFWQKLLKLFGLYN